MWSMADFPTARAQFSAVAGSKAARKYPTTPSLRGTRPPDLDRRDDIEWFVRDDAPALAALAPEWQRLANASPEQSIFTSPQWAATWWAHFGRGRRLHLIGARRAGELVALAPFCTKRRWGVRIREFLGSEETDLGSFLAMPGEDALTGRLVDIVLEDDDWDLLDLWCVASGSPTAAALIDALAVRGVGYDVRQMTSNPILDLNNEAWAAGASRGMLKDLARARRLLGRQGKLELVFPRDDEDFESALAQLRVLHLKRWKSLGETSPIQIAEYWAWVRGIALKAWRQGWLYFPRLLLDGRVVATGIYLLHRRRLFYWMGAHDSDFSRHSPNQLLMLMVIEDTRSAGTVDVLDFGAGSEPYKLRWTQTSLPLLRVMAWRGPAGRAAHIWQGRVRPWAWAHQDLTRPMRRWRRFRSFVIGRTALAFADASGGDGGTGL